jgi:hypothetical protein
MNGCCRKINRKGGRGRIERVLDFNTKGGGLISKKEYLIEWGYEERTTVGTTGRRN